MRSYLLFDRGRTSGRHAFTLLELIVAIVILAVLATLAVPTFKKVIDRSTDEAKAIELAAIGREASALAALDQSATVTPEHYAQATADLEAAGYELGVTAAAGRKWRTTTLLVKDGIFAEAPTYSTDPYTVSVAGPAGTGEPTTAAVQSETGNCVFSTVSEPGALPETWIVDRELGTNCGTGGSTTWADPDDTGNLPTGEPLPTFGAASGAVEDLQAVALGAGAQVTFGTPTYRGTTPITGYEVVATDGTTTQRQTVTTPSAVFANLPVTGAKYTFTVRAINDAGPGEERDASAAAPTATGTIGSRDVQTGTDYSCPNGGSVAGSNCSVPAHTYTAKSSTSYSCPSGGNLSGSTCYKDAYSYAATPSQYYTTSYYCTDGSAVNYGTWPYTCTVSSWGPYGYAGMVGVWSADGNGCGATTPSPQSNTSTRQYINEQIWPSKVTGTNCSSDGWYRYQYSERTTSTVNASSQQNGPYTSYSCPSGGSLSGSTCNVAASSYTAASSTSYSCPDGGSLSTTTCNVPDASYQATATPVMEKRYDVTLTSYLGAQKALVNGKPYTGTALDLGACPGRITTQVIGIGGTTEIDLGTRC